MATDAKNREYQQAPAVTSQLGVTPVIGAGHPAVVQNPPQIAGDNYKPLKNSTKGKD